ncbi:MAG: sensor histidine kinase [Flavobacteriales bacterium]
MKNKPFIIYYILVIYVILQFLWWAYLLMDLNNKYYSEKQRKSVDIEKQEYWKGEKSSKMWMIAGEGAVFFILLTVGFIRLHKTIKQEIELARQQKNFMMAVTHELKSPLSSIRLYLQTLKKRDLSGDKLNDVTDKAVNDTKRLEDMVENVLLAAKLDDESFPLNFEKVELNNFIKSAIDEYKETMGKDHNTYFNKEEQDIHIKADRSALMSIFLNLYENAVKYSDKGSNIKVTTKTESNRAYLYVSDEGPGIPNSELNKVRQKFYRAGNEEERNTKGSGLGLYIVDKLVNMHGGQIYVTNRNEEGATVICEFIKHELR